MLTGDFDLDLLVKHLTSLIACFVQKRALHILASEKRAAADVSCFCCLSTMLSRLTRQTTMINVSLNDADQKMQYRHKIQVNAKQQ